MINPRSQPVQNATEDLAAQNMLEFVAEFQQHGGHMAGNPVRDSSADADGRYGWNVPLVGGQTLRVLMPGLDLGLLTKGTTAQAPCLKVNGTWAWWNGALDLAVAVDPRRYRS
jgi:hypothetical protein